MFTFRFRSKTFCLLLRFIESSHYLMKFPLFFSLRHATRNVARLAKSAVWPMIVARSAVSLMLKDV